MVNGISGVGGFGHDQQRHQMGQQLMQLGIPEETVRQGPQAVEAYAAANGIELPQKPQNIGNTQVDQGVQLSPDALYAKFEEMDNKEINNKQDRSNQKAQFESQLISLGIPSSVVAQGKSAVEAYAKENNITLPEPPQPPPMQGLFQ